jgi:hypothetical protein
MRGAECVQLPASDVYDTNVDNCWNRRFHYRPVYRNNRLSDRRPRTAFFSIARETVRVRPDGNIVFVSSDRSHRKRKILVRRRGGGWMRRSVALQSSTDNHGIGPRNYGDGRRVNVRIFILIFYFSTCTCVMLLRRRTATPDRGLLRWISISTYANIHTYVRNVHSSRDA